MQQPLPAQPPALPPGTVLASRYLIQGYIGGGGFGHIYKAHDRVLGHRRAIKEAFYRDASTAQQFRLEAEFILNARHPHLVRGYSVFEQDGRFYLVMDYVDGNTVEEIAIQHIRQTSRPLPEAQVLDWVLPICDALHALHAQPTPIIHRDVKPANIKVTRQGIPVLIDLGLAKLFSQGTQTIGAALAFTPGYAPPEQYQATGATDQRTDVYGLGATLYYLLTGYQPTEAPARLGPHTLPPPRALNPALSALTEAAVHKAMTLDPAQRQQSTWELARELRVARAALAPQATPVSASSLEAARASDQHHPCLRCGTANPAEARYCLRCGMRIAAAQPSVSSHFDSAREQVAPERAAQPEAALRVPTAASPQPLTLPTPSKLLRMYQRGRGMADQQEEAVAVIGAVLALVFLSLSVVALLAGWALLFALPALGLGIWSALPGVRIGSRRWQWRRAEVPLEFRKIALVAAILGACWPLIWLGAFMLGPG